MAKLKIAAIVTTYKPDNLFFKRVQVMSENCDYVFICDNTPGGHDFVFLGRKIIILQDGINKGLGAALNLGLKKALSLGVSIVHLFDQDSSPTTFLFKKLQQALLAESSFKCCVAPRHVDDVRTDLKIAHTDIDIFDFKSFSCLATSGMTFFISNIQEDDFFDEEFFFLDFVDFEWCWRLALKGWVFKKVMNVEMPHRLGDSERIFFGLKYHVPSAFRHYFQFRDTIRLSRMSYVPIYSKAKLLILLPIKLAIYPIIMDHGLNRLCWMFLGLRDSINSTKGIGAATEILNKNTE
jgi:rhamnosyltransferase